MGKKVTKVKLSKVNELQKELASLLKEKISFTSKWDIRNIMNSFKSEAENLNKTLDEVYKKYGTPDPKSGGFILEPGNIDKVNEEVNKLTDKEIDIVGKIPFKELESISSENKYFEVFVLVEK